MNHTLQSYQVVSDTTPLPVLLSEVNRTQHQCYSPDYSIGRRESKNVVRPYFEYERLLDRLLEIPGVRFLTMEQLIANKGSQDGIRVTIRHDIDGDVVTARTMAETERTRDISTTHYILHTAEYYGWFQDGVFHRHSAMSQYYRDIQDAGHEVGLHIDPLLIYQNFLIDGSEAMATELDWLRSEGLRIVGAAAHNHRTVYGAENYEIFKGRHRNQFMPDGSTHQVIDVPEVVHEGKWAPLHVTDMNELGLLYEAEESFGVDGYIGIMSELANGIIYQTWNTNADLNTRGIDHGPGGWAELDRALSRLEEGDAIIFTTHPCFYGVRSTLHCPPDRHLCSAPIISNHRLGWNTWNPYTAVGYADFDPTTGVQESQTINISNELGLLDKPLFDRSDLGILLVGGEAISPPYHPVYEHLAAILEGLLAESSQEHITVRSTSFRNMAPPRYHRWIDRLIRRKSPPVVLLGINPTLEGMYVDEDRQRLEMNSNDMWLNWNDSTGRVDSIHMSNVTPTPPSDIARSLVEAMNDQHPAGRHLIACLTKTTALIKKRGGTPALLLEPYFAPSIISDASSLNSAFDSLAESIDIVGINPLQDMIDEAGSGSLYDDHGRTTVAGQKAAAASILMQLQSTGLADEVTKKRTAKLFMKDLLVPQLCAEEPEVTVINISSISYTGTSWICSVLASHPNCFLIGPPDRFFEHYQDEADQLCLIHGKDCDFWPEFCRNFDPAENFYVQLAKASGKSHLVINNPRPHHMGILLDDPRVNTRTIRVARDGRAVTASYTRKFEVPFEESVKWYAQAARQSLFGSSDGVLDLRYEDLAGSPFAELHRISNYVGLEFEDNALQYWTFEHHPISGNQGMYAMLKLHQGISLSDFESRDYYEAMFTKGQERQGVPILDERWRDQLSSDQRLLFDLACGEVNRRWGYERDSFTSSQRREAGAAASEMRDIARRIRRERLLRIIKDSLIGLVHQIRKSSYGDKLISVIWRRRSAAAKIPGARMLASKLGIPSAPAVLIRPRAK